MMRVLYFTKANLSLHRAHVYNITRTSEELRKRGMKVTIIRSLGELSRNFDVLYYRDPRYAHVALVARFVLRKKVVLELHSAAPRWYHAPHWWLALRSAHGVIFFTHALKRHYKREGIVVMGNTYDPALYEPHRLRSKTELRKVLELPNSGTLAVYTGSTKTYRFDELIAAVGRVPDARLVVVGATEGTIEPSGRVIVRGRVDLIDVAKYQLAADILVVPYVSDDPGGFPIKIFEYMGAGRPIISFANESIREVLRDGENSILVDPPTAGNWESAIRSLVDRPEMARALAGHALEEAPRHTWSARGAAIAGFVQRGFTQ